MYIDPTLITGNIIEAYDTFAGLGFEKVIIIQVQDLDSVSMVTDYTVRALWLAKENIKIKETNLQFATESRPSMYIKTPNMPDDPLNPGQKVDPKHNWRIFKEEDPDRQFSIDSINKIFNFVVLRLKQ